MSTPEDPWFLDGATDRASGSPAGGAFGSSDNPFMQSIASAMSSPAPRVVRPPSLYIAMGALALASVLSLVATVVEVLSILDRPQRTAESIAGDPVGTVTGLGGGEYVDGTETKDIIFVIGLGVAFAVAYALFAAAVYQGRHWPRIVGSVLAVISLFGFLGGPLVVVTVFCGLIAIAALWVPASRRYCDYVSARQPAGDRRSGFV